MHPGTRPCPRGHCEPLPNVSAHCQHRDSPSSSTSPLSSASGPPWPAVGSHIECPCFCTWRPICQGPGRKHPRRSFRSECGLGYFTVERLNRNQGSVGSQVRRQLIVFGKRVCYFWFLRGWVATPWGPTPWGLCREAPGSGGRERRARWPRACATLGSGAREGRTG